MKFKYLNELKELLKRHGYYKPEELLPFNDKQIEEIEIKLGVKLPQAIKEYFKISSNYFNFRELPTIYSLFTVEEIGFKSIEQFEDYDLEAFDNVPPLPENALVISGPTDSVFFSFVLLNGDENPDVFEYPHSQKKFENIGNFKDHITHCIKSWLCSYHSLYIYENDKIIPYKELNKVGYSTYSYPIVTVDNCANVVICIKDKEIPVIVNKFKSLISIYCGKVGLTQISNLENELIYLENLNFEENNITNLSENLLKFKNLKRLYLSNNKISEIPQQISNLINLEELDLSKNSLNKNIENLFNLENLKELNLSDNNIEYLPTIPENMLIKSKLTYLNLFKNKLSKLNESILLLSELKRLILNYNDLKDLPDSLIENKNLEYISLVGNLNFDPSRLIELSKQNNLREKELKIILSSEVYPEKKLIIK